MSLGEIVLIPFPFSELTNIKVRPALVITHTKDKYQDLILAAISSQVPQYPSSYEIVLYPDENNGLRVSSVIKVDRIFTLKSEKVIAVLGKVNKPQLKDFKHAFVSLVE